LVFSLNGTEKFNSIRLQNRLCSLPNSAELGVLDNAKLKILFYCHEAGKITYGCNFNGFWKDRKYFVSTSRYAKKTLIMRHTPRYAA
jgi:hypothetical protein